MLEGHILLIVPYTATLLELVIQRTLRPSQCLQRCYNLLKMMRITDNCKHKTTQLVRVNAKSYRREGVMWSGSARVRCGFSSWRGGGDVREGTQEGSGLRLSGKKKTANRIRNRHRWDVGGAPMPEQGPFCAGPNASRCVIGREPGVLGCWGLVCRAGVK